MVGEVAVLGRAAGWEEGMVAALGRDRVVLVCGSRCDLCSKCPSTLRQIGCRTAGSDRCMCSGSRICSSISPTTAQVVWEAGLVAVLVAGMVAAWGQGLAVSVCDSRVVVCSMCRHKLQPTQCRTAGFGTSMCSASRICSSTCPKTAVRVMVATAVTGLVATGHRGT